jgi:hypothetical protein
MRFCSPDNFYNAKDGRHDSGNNQRNGKEPQNEVQANSLTPAPLSAQLVHVPPTPDEVVIIFTHGTSAVESLEILLRSSWQTDRKDCGRL